MFIFDIVRAKDKRLRAIALTVGTGMFVLLAGLWFVQIAWASRFETNLKKQSFRNVRIPAIRGKILDRDGLVLADNRPRYNAILYLEDLQSRFAEEYGWLSKSYGRAHPEVIKTKGRLSLAPGTSRALQLEAYCDVVSNITFYVSSSLREPRLLNTNAFIRHYNNYPYVPFEIVPNLAPQQVAIFAEQLSGQPDVELETQPIRHYPNGAVAAHLLGYVQRENFDSEEISFTLPDYEGKTGVEGKFNEELRGQAGLKSVLVNSQNYRQSEDIVSSNAPGEDVYLTIDLAVQRAAEKALAGAQANVRGAVVVMDVRNGDIIALASAPSYDPNEYAVGLTHEQSMALNDPKNKPQFDRAISGAYPPGSTFKIITGLACLESGLDPNEEFNSPGKYQANERSRPIKDTAGPGLFNFERAFFRSSNTYFIHYGMEAGLPKILSVARRFHLGEKTDFPIGPEVAGNIAHAAMDMPASSTADVCIGQEVTTTPIQMAGLVCAIANGGKIYWPRLASYSVSPETDNKEELYPPGRLRDTVAINPRFLEIIRHAMLADTEHPADATTREGGAYPAFHYPGGAAKLPNFHVAGKTGTAEVKSAAGVMPKITWFDSYGPYENPRYAVIVLVEGGGSGGGTCAPVAEKIYEALIKRDQSAPTHGSTLAKN
jgi:penicillin-binding protein 2